MLVIPVLVGVGVVLTITNKHMTKNKERLLGVMSDNVIALAFGLGCGGCMVVAAGREWLHDQDDGLSGLFYGCFLPCIMFATALRDGEKITLSDIIFAIVSTLSTTLLLGQMLDMWSSHMMIWSTVLTPINLPSRKMRKNNNDDDDTTTLQTLLHCESLISGTFVVIIFSSLTSSSTTQDPTDIVLAFFKVVVGSAAWGSVVAFLCTASLHFEEFQTQELVLFIFWSLLAFSGSHALALNPTASLFFCGVVMSKTSLLALTDRACTSIQDGMNAIARAAETIILVYLGMACIALAVTTTTTTAAFQQTILTFCVVFFASLFIRMIFASILCLLVKLLPHAWFPIQLPGFKLTMAIVVLSSIRGVTSFTLALVTGKQDLIVITAIVVICGHIILAPLLTWMLWRYNDDNNDDGDDDQFPVDAVRSWPSPKVIRGEGSASLPRSYGTLEEEQQRIMS